MRYLLVHLILVNCLTCPLTRAQSKEYQIKAVFLFNFSKFVEWPPDAFSSARAPFIIGILGEDPFGHYIDETVRGEAIDGHQMIVKRFQNVGSVDCQILFIAKNVSVQQVKPYLKRGMLIVGESEEFAMNGGVIGFKDQDDKVKIQINVSRARDQDLSISSRLLAIAEIVK